MSNESLKSRISLALESFKNGNRDIAALINAIEINGQALENMSYDMIKELGNIEYLLTMSQFADEEGCETKIEEVIPVIECWLKNTPR